WGLAFLVAENYGPHVPGVAGADCGVYSVHRVQLHVLSAIHCGNHGHAAAVSHVSAGISDLQRDVHGRSFDSRGRLSAADGVSHLGGILWKSGGRESLACDRAGVEDAIASV